MTNPYNQPTKCVSTTTSWFNPSGTAHYVRPILQPDIYVETNNTLERIIAGNSVRVAKLQSLLKEKRGQHRAEEAATAAEATEEKRQREFAAAVQQHRDEELSAIDMRRRPRHGSAMSHKVAEEEEAAATALQAEEAQDYRNSCDCNFQRPANRNRRNLTENQEEERRKRRIDISSRSASQPDHEVTLANCHLELAKWDLQRNAQMDSEATFNAFFSVENKPRRTGTQWRGTGKVIRPYITSSGPGNDTCCDFDHCNGFCADIKTTRHE